MRDTIDMAREAGDDEWKILIKQVIKHFPDEIERFVFLVRADERGIQREKTLAALMSIERKGDWITKEEAFEAIQRVEN